MYSPLLDTQTGPITRNRMAGPLRGVLRVFNFCLAVIGASLLSAALYMFTVYHRTGLIPPPPPSIPSITHINVRDALNPVDNNDEDTNSLWFVWSVGAAGAVFTLIAFAGMVGLQPENRRRLSFYIILLSFLVIAELALMFLLFTENPWKAEIPADPTGFLPLILDFINDNARIIKLFGLGIIFVELFGLGAACWLQSMYERAYEDWLDGIEARQQRTSERLERTVENMYTSSDNGGLVHSTWKSRIRGKYGLDSGEIENTAAVAAAVQESGLVDEGRQRRTTTATDAP